MRKSGAGRASPYRLTQNPAEVAGLKSRTQEGAGETAGATPEALRGLLPPNGSAFFDAFVIDRATGAPTLVDLGAGFPVVTGGLQTSTIWCPATGTSIWLRAVSELTGAVFEQEVTTDLLEAATSSHRASS